MKVLELEPIKNKKIFVFLIKKEDNNLTTDESQILADIIEKYDFKFATIVLEEHELINFKKTDLAFFLNECMLPCFQVDIPEYAKGYLSTEISEKEEELRELKSEYENLEEKNSSKADHLKSWIEYLEERVHEKNEYLKTKLKAQWIVQNILNIIKYYEDSLFYEDTLYVLHFTPKELVKNLKEIMEELGIIVIIGEIIDKTLIPMSIIQRLEAN